MATVEQNKEAWDRYWPDGGDAWSQAWGGVATQWFGAILMRIHRFLPVETILEIAPGHGRWTQFLKDHCESLIVVDLAESCVEACRKRFSSYTNIRYHVNDGKSLHMVEDKSVGFVFSFDSLVHADADVIEAYLGQLASKLKPDGVGFIHHSNLGACKKVSTGQWPPDFTNPHWRAESMTARLFEEYCEKAGLQCITQEIVNWGGELLNDCFSLFTPGGSVLSRPNRVYVNDRFMDEAKRISMISEMYGLPGP